MNQLIKNRIQKQLLNFDQQDIEFDKSNSVQKTIDKSIEKEKWILENMVDLGLPSGTLWMKNNFGATCEDSPESWNGDYYAWGELASKKEYYEEIYTYKDNPVILPLDHDIVYQKTNGICYMPTKSELEELSSLSNTWVTNYNGISGLNGRVFTGTNGNTLFIPAAGYYSGSIIYNYGSSCYLWSNSVNQSDTDYAYYLTFYSNTLGIYGNCRYIGQSVRGVL